MRHFSQQVFFILSCCLLTFRLAAQPLSKQPVIRLSTQGNEVSLRGHLAYFRDSLATRTIADMIGLASGNVFQPIATPVPNFGYVTGIKAARPVWLRFRLENGSKTTQAWLAEVDFWSFDSLQLFIVDSHNRVLSASPVIGWKTPATQRIRYHRHYWFPFTVPAHERVTAYFRMYKQRGTQLVPISLIRESAYESLVQKGYLFWGGVLFALTFVAVMSLIFFLTTLDQIYSKYIFCLLGLVGFFVINDGFLNQFGFELQFWLPRQNIYFLFPLILFYSQLTFVRTFLSVKNTPSRRWHTIGTVVLWCGLFCLLGLTIELITPFSPTVELIMVRIFSIFYWFPMPVIGAYIVVGIVRRYHVGEAWLYLIAVSPFYALNLGQVFANFGLIPTVEPVANFTYYAVAALFEVLVLTIGLAYRYKMERDRTERLIKESTDQQQRAYEAEVQALALKNSLLVEKERIARDLHDNVGAHLAFIVTNLTHISDQAEKQSTKEGKQWASRLRTIVMHTREAVKLLRETIWAIHQESFTVEEFDERLNQYINRYFHEPDGLHVDVQVMGSQSQRLSSTQVLNLFRIVQEALNNVVKHAQATVANVQLQVSSGGRINLRIHDNGCGFTWNNTVVSSHHYGLQNMQTRAQELGGTFRVFAEEGTTVEVDV
ncbi:MULTISPECIES: 7TM-DISM domain-containing protein [unclassified Spirosoma]|uniref:sensor histidine kinase n=1 Tax=unclassified Spirosoma TaxID=2621999 RepID=UPI0009611774|nr:MULTISPECIES: 7TM-DISM domain-containing protein [unclassified Spirosoma]MBN8825981.1 histidine kinase [Spirosoma sp.]OJW71011.1 MAG: histidine kinase [Spirosoma sp. 48-14]